MAENTKIEWADHTFNPWIGCAKVHTGCQNCYAESDMDTRRGRVKWGLHGTRSATTMAYWQNPLKWNRLGAANRPRVFCASLADVFEDWQGPVIDSQHRRLFTINGDEWFAEAEYQDCRPLTIADLRRKLFETIDDTPNLDWLLLTKRPENVRGMWSGVCHDTDMGGNGATMTMHRPNVHLLYSASDQPSLDAGIGHLLKCRPLVPVLGLSLEPLVGPVDIFAAWGDAIRREGGNAGQIIDWVIVGGESGPGARPMHPDWVRSIRDQCQAAGAAFFFKQWGEWEPAHHYWSSQADGETVMAELVSLRSQYQLAFGGDGGLDDLWRHRDTVMARAGKKAAGRELDWREWNELPEVQG